MPINTPPKSYDDAAVKWKRCRDCFEGSDAVKAAGPEYLPPLGSHDNTPKGRAQYAAYKARALFYNATARTVQGLAGLIFQKVPTFELTPAIEGHEQDITMAEESAELFALHATEEVLTTGRYGVLVEMSAAGESPSRPYWVGYSAEDICSYRTERRGGEQVLARVVLKESYWEPDPDDEFKEDEVTQFRVLSLGDEDSGYSLNDSIFASGDGNKRYYRQTIYREEEKSGEWLPVEEYVPTRRAEALDFIPFIIIGPTSVTPEISKPPLLDLVDVNLSHYRGSADLKHGLHKVALPQPWASGIQGAGTDDGAITIGPSVVWMLDSGGRAGMVEFTGAGLGAIRTDQLDQQALMATLGARLLEEGGGPPETATAVRMKHAGENATIRTIAASMETGLTQVFQWHAWWAGTEEDPKSVEAGIELNKDFFSQRATPDDVKAAMLLWQSGGISFETFYHNLEQGEWTRPGVDAEEEHQELVAEGVADPGPVDIEEEVVEVEAE